MRGPCAPRWRAGSAGTPQRRTVHFEAPPADRLTAEIDSFLAWFNAETGDHPLIKAGLAHLWLVTLRPFDDGNGRLGRAVGDLPLARTDRIPQRYYSVSAQIQGERNAYHEISNARRKAGSTRSRPRRASGSAGPTRR